MQPDVAIFTSPDSVEQIEKIANAAASGKRVQTVILNLWVAHQISSGEVVE